jgi:hypothetical protein
MTRGQQNIQGMVGYLPPYPIKADLPKASQNAPQKADPSGVRGVKMKCTFGGSDPFCPNMILSNAIIPEVYFTQEQNYSTQSIPAHSTKYMHQVPSNFSSELDSGVGNSYTSSEVENESEFKWNAFNGQRNLQYSSDGEFTMSRKSKSRKEFPYMGAPLPVIESGKKLNLHSNLPEIQGTALRKSGFFETKPMRRSSCSAIYDMDETLSAPAMRPPKGHSYSDCLEEEHISGGVLDDNPFLGVSNSSDQIDYDSTMYQGYGSSYNPNNSINPFYVPHDTLRNTGTIEPSYPPPANYSEYEIDQDVAQIRKILSDLPCNIMKEQHASHDPNAQSISHLRNIRNFSPRDFRLQEWIHLEETLESPGSIHLSR